MSAVVSEVLEVWSHRPRTKLETRLLELPRTAWGRRGYEESAVDDLMAGVEQDLDHADGQIDDLRTEVDRLHRYIRRQWAAVAAAEAAGRPRGRHAVVHEDEDAPRAGVHGKGSAGPGRRDSPSGDASPSGPSPTAQARAVLTQAQEIADRRLAQADARVAEAERIARVTVAEAEADARARLAQADDEVAARLAAADEASGHRLARTERMAEQVLTEAVEESTTRRTRAVDDAHRLLVLARARYEDIIVRAHQRADHAAEVALGEFSPGDGEDGETGRERAELEIKAAYLSTFAKVSRVALRVALDVSAREFDTLLSSTAALEDDLTTPRDHASLSPDPLRDQALVHAVDEDVCESLQETPRDHALVHGVDEEPGDAPGPQSRPAALSAR